MQPTDILLALLTVLIWGMNFVVIKIGLAGLPPLLFSALRFVFAALPLVFFIKRPATPWRLLIGFALFQFAFQFSLLFSGMQLGIGAGLASLVIQLQAFFTIGLAVLLLGERPLATQLLGALVALAGMVLVATHLEAKSTVVGFLMVIGAGMSWASANIVTKKIGKINPLALMAWGSLMAAPPLLLASAVLEGPAAWHSAFSHFGWISVAAVLYQSYPNTIIGYGIWTILMRKYPAATVAPFSLLVPLVGMLSAAILLDESLQWWKIVAGLLVLAGLALNLFGARLLLLMKTVRS
ncbi:Permease of the drug/metabolite transporter (DMT) superfamily [Collimonas arenae]|uniref:Permease of the drug/metabolite transporter (DMT) superfamily n=1 Tax=Collimonas arenae TaxID=279058 RepID=A0A0A1FDV6_9BURK|nr:EamA family transporter [Collimonas arenae]AIY41042.1 Permease of the drug/metabolite transporter (DMT) superfamily [Collimonas arenae]